MKPYEKITIAGSIRSTLPKKRFELTEKQIEGLKTTAEIILAIGMTAGAIALAVMAPNAIQLMGGLVKNKRYINSKEFKEQQRRRLTKSIYYLKRRGDIELTPTGNDFMVKITAKGRKKARQLNFESLKIDIGKTRNGKWWLVLADIPSKPFRSRADSFRDKLKALGFYPLQRTVWVFPFDPRDEVDFVAAYYSLEKFVTTMEVSKLDPEDEKILYDFFRKKQII